MSEEKIDGYYRRAAKETVDLLFDKRFLNDQLSRDAVVWLEDYVAFLFDSYCKSAVKAAQLSARFRDSK
jgi:hypothetical protein